MKHVPFLRDIAGVEPPKRLQAMLVLLAGAGCELLEPAPFSGVHPLVIPLAREPSGALLGFLRWPTPNTHMPLPIVRQHVDDPDRRWTLELVAPSTEALIHRELAVRDAQGGELPDVLLAAANAGGILYAPGMVKASGLPIKAYLLLKVGETHAFFEELVGAHLKKGDLKAAAITVDRACRDPQGWARPMVFRAMFLEGQGHLDEARDTAIAALSDPIWTFGHPVQRVAHLAGWTVYGSQAWRKLAANEEKSPADRAAHLMDAVAVDNGDWDALRPTLKGLYKESGLDSVAALVGSSVI